MHFLAFCFSPAHIGRYEHSLHAEKDGSEELVPAVLRFEDFGTETRGIAATAVEENDRVCVFGAWGDDHVVIAERYV
jgi:hypothetical protein